MKILKKYGVSVENWDEKKAFVKYPKVVMKRAISLIELGIALLIVALIAFAVIANSKGSVENTEMSNLWSEASTLISKNVSVGTTLGTYAGLDAAKHEENGLISHEYSNIGTNYTINSLTADGRIKSSVKKGCYHLFVGATDGVSFTYKLDCEDVVGWSAGDETGANMAKKNRLTSLFANNAKTSYGLTDGSIIADKTTGKLSIELRDLN
jgi:hypothetical protein